MSASMHPSLAEVNSPDSTLPIPSHAADEPGLPLPFEILPVIVQAQEAFQRWLPQLLKERRGQWVAFHGDQLLGFADTKTALYHTCLRQGHERGKFLVRAIEPQIDVLTLGPREVV